MTTVTPPKQLLYKPENAGAILDMGRTSVYHLMATGELKSVRIGRSRRIPASALEDYINKLQSGAETVPTPKAS
jgi:excisionase family DNA binding protein